MYDHTKPSIAAEDVQWALNVADTEFDQELVHVEFDQPRFLEYGNWRGHGYTRCLWSALQTVVTPDGRVWTCCNKRGIDSACLGDLTKESFSEIWKRRPVAQVNDQCRILCRGHMPNKFLHQITKPKVHGNFI